MSYENATFITYQIPAGVLTSAATLETLIGPAGLQGRLESVTTVVTTDVTVAAASVDVGITGTLAKYGTASVPISVADAALNTVTITDTDDNPLPADTVFLVSTDGAATAGAANINVTIAWF